jgi:hypothetical protein
VMTLIQLINLRRPTTQVESRGGGARGQHPAHRRGVAGRARVEQRLEGEARHDPSTRSALRGGGDTCGREASNELRWVKVWGGVPSVQIVFLILIFQYDIIPTSMIWDISSGKSLKSHDRVTS